MACSTVRHGDGCGLIVTGSSKCASCVAGTGLTCASAGKLTTGGHVDIEDGRQFGLVPHGLVVTPSVIHPDRAERHRAAGPYPSSLSWCRASLIAWIVDRSSAGPKRA